MNPHTQFAADHAGTLYGNVVSSHVPAHIAWIFDLAAGPWTVLVILALALLVPSTKEQNEN